MAKARRKNKKKRAMRGGSRIQSSYVILNGQPYPVPHATLADYGDLMEALGMESLTQLSDESGQLSGKKVAVISEAVINALGDYGTTQKISEWVDENTEEGFESHETAAFDEALRRFEADEYDIAEIFEIEYVSEGEEEPGEEDGEELGTIDDIEDEEVLERLIEVEIESRIAPLLPKRLVFIPELSVNQMVRVFKASMSGANAKKKQVRRR